MKVCSLALQIGNHHSHPRCANIHQMLRLDRYAYLSIENWLYRLISYCVWNPHYLRRWILMIEEATMFEIAFFLIEPYDFNFILSVFDKWTQWKSKVLFHPIAKVDWVKVPLWFMSVYLLSISHYPISILYDLFLLDGCSCHVSYF